MYDFQLINIIALIVVEKVLYDLLLFYFLYNSFFYFLLYILLYNKRFDKIFDFHNLMGLHVFRWHEYDLPKLKRLCMTFSYCFTDFVNNSTEEKARNSVRFHITLELTFNLFWLYFTVYREWSGSATLRFSWFLW